MAYQVLARKWRPGRFDDVIGQLGVTRTLRNAIESGRIAQAYVFAGPRGVGKTTVARILARALNCVKGPTPDPCGVCDACVDIAEGRDLDVLEIDAATHTGVDKVRDTIIDTLGFSPVRHRYKVFVIDEVHRLSVQAFDALLKSIEEPPPHVIFMMATTEIDKVPDTIQSRSQVFELKAIGLKLIVERLRQIALAEGLEVEEPALVLIARAADGSVRDALSALDQVLGFSGDRVDAESVSTVLGLVRRELVLEIVEAVAREDAPALFDLAGRAVEAGYDLRQVCRELTRAVRDLLVIAIDPSRVQDPEIAAEGERESLPALAKRFSREDLMRAFDVLARAEFEIRGAPQPRYHLEMALLRWIHLRKLVPLADLIAGLESGNPRPTLPPPPPGRPSPAPPRGAPPVPMAGQGNPSRASARPTPTTATARREDSAKSPGAERSEAVDSAPDPIDRPTSVDRPTSSVDRDPTTLKDAFLARIRQDKRFFYGTVVAQAHRIAVAANEITFAFAPAHKALRAQLEQHRPWLEGIAEAVAGRRMAVVSAEAAAAPPAEPAGPAADAEAQTAELRARAMKNEGVQALLDVFGAEIKEIKEM